MALGSGCAPKTHVGPTGCKLSHVGGDRDADLSRRVLSEPNNSLHAEQEPEFSDVSSGLSNSIWILGLHFDPHGRSGAQMMPMHAVSRGLTMFCISIDFGSIAS